MVVLLLWSRKRKWILSSLPSRYASPSPHPVNDKINGFIEIGVYLQLVGSSILVFLDVLVQETYYKPLLERGKIKEEDLDLYVFASKPSAGAAVLKI